MRLVKMAKVMIDRVRRLLGNSNLKDVNYIINKDEVINDLEIISKINNINQPEIKFISDTCVLLKK